MQCRTEREEVVLEETAELGNGLDMPKMIISNTEDPIVQLLNASIIDSDKWDKKILKMETLLEKSL